jgi:hypothetical protein
MIMAGGRTHSGGRARTGPRPVLRSSSGRARPDGRGSFPRRPGPLPRGLPGPHAHRPAQRVSQHVPEPGEGPRAAAEQPGHAPQGPQGPGRHRHRPQVGRRAGRQAVRWPAAGDRRGPVRLLQSEGPAPRRAARGHGRRGGRPDHRPRQGPQEQGEVSIIIVAHNYGQVLEICDRVNLLQHGEITFDKPSRDTSVQELNDIVIEERRRPLLERQPTG